MKNFTSLLMSLMISSASFAADNADNKAPAFIYSVVNNHGTLEILLNPLSEWENEQRLIDSYTPEQSAFIEPIIDEALLCYVAESVFELCRGDEGLAHALEVFKKYGLTNLKDFQEWAEKQILMD